MMNLIEDFSDQTYVRTCEQQISTLIRISFSKNTDQNEMQVRPIDVFVLALKSDRKLCTILRTHLAVLRRNMITCAREDI